MFEKLVQIFKIKDLRKKILYTVALLVVFRLAAQIPVPGANTENLKRFFESNQLFGLLNVFTGGAMENLSVVMLGVGPYITATIIMQLLSMIVPSVQKMMKEEGEAGRNKFNQWSRILTVPLAAMQGYAMINMLSRGNQPVITNLTGWTLITTIVCITAGSIFLMWLGELITESGVGNGISLIIFAGIVTKIPQSIYQTAITFDPSQLINMIIFSIIAIVVIAGIVFVTEARRNIPVSYARRVRGMKMYGGAQTYLPLRVNAAGVIPIIFAMSVMLFPGMVANFFVNSSQKWLASVAQNTAHLFQNQTFYSVLYFVLVVAFTYFYTSVIFEPKSVAEHLQKQGGFVPGIRPGRPTQDYLRQTVNKITLAGALFLGVVAILPFLVQAGTKIATFNYMIGGTSILIVVSVVLETVKQVESQMIMRDYKGF